MFCQSAHCIMGVVIVLQEAQPTGQRTGVQTTSSIMDCRFPSHWVVFMGVTCLLGVLWSLTLKGKWEHQASEFQLLWCNAPQWKNAVLYWTDLKQSVSGQLNNPKPTILISVMIKCFVSIKNGNFFSEFPFHVKFWHFNLLSQFSMKTNVEMLEFPTGWKFQISLNSSYYLNLWVLHTNTPRSELFRFFH